MNINHPPLVLCLSGLDPTGGAGISADIQTLGLLNCHPLPLITSITSQNGNQFKTLAPIVASDLITQIEDVLMEFKDRHPIAFCKLGLTHPKNEIEKVLVHLRNLIPNLTFIIDPIWSISSQPEAAIGTHLESLLVESVLNSRDVLTPNQTEFFALAQIKTPTHASDWAWQSPLLMKALSFYQSRGVHQIFITSYKKSEANLEHWLMTFESDQKKWQLQIIQSQSLAGEYHGSGCTLSSALTGFLALGYDLESAGIKAIEFTHQSLVQSQIRGIYQKYPNRTNLTHQLK